MNERRFIRKIIRESGLTRRQLCEKIGWKTRQSLAQIEKQRSLSVWKFYRVCEALGYEIVVRKKNYLRLVEGETIIESDNSVRDIP